MKIQYFIRHVYGVPTLYLTGKEAEHVNMLTGKMTLLPRHIKALEALGIGLERVDDPATVGNKCGCGEPAPFGECQTCKDGVAACS